MRTLIIAVALAAVGPSMGWASPVLAQTQGQARPKSPPASSGAEKSRPPQSSAQETDAAVRGLLAWAQNLQPIQMQIQQVAEAAMIHAGEANQMAEKRRMTLEEAKDWNAAWALDIRGKLDAISDKLSALPPPPDVPVDLIAADHPARLFLNSLPQSTQESIVRCQKLVDEVSKYAPNAATGDQESIRRLAATALTAYADRLENANLAAEGQIALIDHSHPEYSLVRAFMAENLIQVDLLRAAARGIAGESPDPEAPARIKAGLATARNAIRKVGPQAAESQAAVNRQSAAFTPQLMRDFNSAFATYAQSVEIEFQVCVTLERASEALKAGDAKLALDRAAEVDPLILKRIELDNQRREFLAGAPGG